MSIDNIKATLEAKLGVEVTFISETDFSIHSEDVKIFESAKNLLKLANQTIIGEEHDAECGFFAYYSN